MIEQEEHRASTTITAVYRAENAEDRVALSNLAALLRTADVVAAMSVEALLGTDAAFAADLVALRPHPGQVHVAGRLRVPGHRAGGGRRPRRAVEPEEMTRPLRLLAVSAGAALALSACETSTQMSAFAMP